MLTKKEPEKKKRPEEDPMSDIYWLKRLAPKRKRIRVGDRGRLVRVWSFVDDLVELVAGFYDYNRGTIRNVALLWGIYYFVKNGKLPKNKKDVINLYWFVYRNILYTLNIYASAYHVTGGPNVDFETALKIVQEQIRKQKEELKVLENESPKDITENKEEEGGAKETG
jgi:hypothetical protein